MIGWEYPCQVDARFFEANVLRNAPRRALGFNPLGSGSIIRERSPPGWASGRPGRSTRPADAPSRCGPAARGRWRG